jgi:epoxide hydrolase
LPLLVTHGYPSSVAEFLEVIGPLTDPRAHGGDPADAFHVVAPSLPGFGFSVPLQQAGWESGRTARAWVELMGRLGYTRYGAHGGDIGAGVSGDLSGLDPERVVGAHVNTDPTGLALLDLLPAELDGLSEAEAASHQRLRQYGQDGKGGSLLRRALDPRAQGGALVGVRPRRPLPGHGGARAAGRRHTRILPPPPLRVLSEGSWGAGLGTGSAPQPLGPTLWR